LKEDAVGFVVNTAGKIGVAPPETEALGAIELTNDQFNRRLEGQFPARLSLFPAVAIAVRCERRRVFRREIDIFRHRFFFGFG
jgi:hypothetical protein